MTSQAAAIEIPTRKQVIAKHRQGGGLVAAVFPYHYPRALLHALGIQPVELWGPPGVDCSSADDHVQAYICSLVRNGLAFLMDKAADQVDLILVPHGCDSLQGLGSALLDFIKPAKPVFTMYVARSPLQAGTDYLAREFERLADSLCAKLGLSLDQKALVAAMDAEELADRQVDKLFAVRRTLAISDREFYRVLRSREYLPTAEFCALGEQVIASAAEANNEGRIPVILSGIVPEPMDLLDAIGRANGMVVGDDTAAVGRRVYPRIQEDDPFLRMAKTILASPPDSTRGVAIDERVRHLRGLVQATGARGVLFYNVKFCEPEAFYYPRLRAALEAEGIRTLEMEGELAERLPAQMNTRIEAFLETLS